MADFALTSTGFTEGTPIPPKFACDQQNTSPDLAWTPGPIGTLSYAVVLTDKSDNLLHWVIWDIPGATTALPAAVENTANPASPAGSKQVKSYDNKTFGYLGPCPPNEHTYEFAAFALDVATLANVTTASTRAQVKAEILNHDLATTTLTGTYKP
jgi:Raf kinase inhibitor-like YbhB/YbcL family protein